MRITIDTIPHADQNYETIGDYWSDETGMHIRISEMGDWRFEMLVAVHELVEAALCKVRGITDGEITAFDVEFEEKRKPGDISEPGDSRDAPYASEHNFATAVERMMCAAMGVAWQDYEQAVLRLSK